MQRPCADVQARRAGRVRTAEIIHARPHHPLRALIDPDTGQLWGAGGSIYNGFAFRAHHVVDVADMHAGKAHQAQFALQDATDDRVRVATDDGVRVATDDRVRVATDDRDQGAGGEDVNQRCVLEFVDVDRVPIEKSTLARLERTGEVPAGTLEAATPCHGWTAKDLLAKRFETLQEELPEATGAEADAQEALAAGRKKMAELRSRRVGSLGEQGLAEIGGLLYAIVVIGTAAYVVREADAGGVNRVEALTGLVAQTAVDAIAAQIGTGMLGLTAGEAFLLSWMPSLRDDGSSHGWKKAQAVDEFLRDRGIWTSDPNYREEFDQAKEFLLHPRPLTLAAADDSPTPSITPETVAYYQLASMPGDTIRGAHDAILDWGKRIERKLDDAVHAVGHDVSKLVTDVRDAVSTGVRELELKAAGEPGAAAGAKGLLA